MANNETQPALSLWIAASEAICAVELDSKKRHPDNHLRLYTEELPNAVAGLLFERIADMLCETIKLPARSGLCCGQRSVAW